MAIHPILASLIPALSRGDDLLEIAGNVYVAPSEPDGPPAPSPGLLADLAPGEAPAPGRVSRADPGVLGPAPVADRDQAEPTPAPSLIGLRAPRIAAGTPMPETVAPRRPDADAPAPRLPAFPRGTTRDPAPGPGAPPIEPAGGTVGGASGFAQRAALPGPPDAPNAGRPAVTPPTTRPSVTEPPALGAGVPGKAEPGPSPAAPEPGPVLDTPSSPTGAAWSRPDASRVRHAEPEPRPDAAPATAGDAAPSREARSPVPWDTGTVPARDRHSVPGDATAEGRPHPRSGDRTPPLEAAAFVPGGGAEQTERAGIIASCILNAAMIPGWPPPRPFAVPGTEELFVRFGRTDAVPAQADVLAFLKRNGCTPARLARLRQKLAKLARSRRLRTLLGLAALMATIEAVLEAVEAELGQLARSGGDSDEPGAEATGRRRLRV